MLPVFTWHTRLQSRKPTGLVKRRQSVTKVDRGVKQEVACAGANAACRHWFDDTIVKGEPPAKRPFRRACETHTEIVHWASPARGGTRYPATHLSVYSCLQNAV